MVGASLVGTDGAGSMAVLEKAKRRKVEKVDACGESWLMYCSYLSRRSLSARASQSQQEQSHLVRLDLSMLALAQESSRGLELAGEQLLEPEPHPGPEPARILVQSCLGEQAQKLSPQPQEQR